MRRAKGPDLGRKMREIWKPLSAVVFSAIVAGAITGFPGIDTAKATGTKATDTAAQASKAQVTKSQVIKAQAAAIDTSERGWPYNGKAVRIVTTDRLR